MKFKLELIFKILFCKNTEVLTLINKKLIKSEITYSDKEWLRKLSARGE